MSWRRIVSGLAVLALALIGVVVLLGVLLVLSGGVVFKSQIPALSSRVEQAWLPGRYVEVERSQDEDRLCFLQCLATRLTVEYADSSSSSAEARCATAYAVFQQWIATTGVTAEPDDGDCFYVGRAGDNQHLVYRVYVGDGLLGEVARHGHLVLTIVDER